MGTANAFRATLLIFIGSLGLAACGGGGGGAIGPATAIMSGGASNPQTGNSGSSTSSNTASSSTSSGASSSSTGSSSTGTSSTPSASAAPAPFTFIDTGITGTVEVPAPASFGASPVPAQIAGGPFFEPTVFPTAGTTYPNNGVSFPVLSSILQFTPSGLSAVSTNQSATAILSNSTSFAGETNIQLNVPSVGLNVTWSTQDILSNFEDFWTFGLSYVVLGSWSPQYSPSRTPIGSAIAFAFGYETPATSMPTTGPASFSGWTNGTVFTPVGGSIVQAFVRGGATFSADFASGKITGAFTRKIHPA